MFKNKENSVKIKKEYNCFQTLILADAVAQVLVFTTAVGQNEG
jgi:hypothetical protein